MAQTIKSLNLQMLTTDKSNVTLKLRIICRILFEHISFFSDDKGLDPQEKVAKCFTAISHY
jgi:hypothetical protein